MTLLVGVSGWEWGKRKTLLREENKKPAYKTSGVHLVGHQFINSTGAPLSTSRQQKFHALQGFYINREISALPGALLCYFKHLLSCYMAYKLVTMLQGAFITRNLSCMKISFTVLSLSSASQTNQSWQKLDLKVDVFVLCNLTFSSIHTSFGQLHHKWNTLRFKDRLLFKTLLAVWDLKEDWIQAVTMV